MKAKDVIRQLKKRGWIEVRQTGSHKQFLHPVLPGRVTVPCHSKDLPSATLHSILKQAGLKEVNGGKERE